MSEVKEKHRNSAFEILKSVESSEASEQSLPQLKFLMSQPYQWFRISAAKLLGEIESDAAITLLAIALNDRCEYVAEAAAESLVKIGSPRALEILQISFWEDQIKRPHYLADAIAQFGVAGFEILKQCTESKSPTIRYYAAKGLGATGIEEAAQILEPIAEFDLEETPFNSNVAAGARKGLKTLRKKLV